MYELSRVRLYSIGPAGARYADTVLDLRGVGEPVPSPAPAQAEFFEDEPVGPPRRPAPAGVLFLENGGGKSVLLKLIFSVMLPGHRNTLGGASSGVLRKFLLADDCGHVALEWQHTLTGECVVVGKVSEWRGRQVSNDPRKFAEAWYSFRPGPGLSLDSLPVAEATAVGRPAEGVSGARGRRRTMKGFRDALVDAGKFYQHLDVHWEEIHDRWNEHLGDLGLDPELFRYQREMNADEGEAAGLFAVKKDSDFTDLLLRAVTDTRDTDGLADLVSGFGNKLGRRAELTAERDFTAGSVDLLNRIVEATGARARSRDIHTAAERRTRTLARRLSARAAEERGRTAELAERVTAAAHTVTEAESARGRRSLIAAELAYRHASLALAGAEKRAAAGRKELAEARTLHAAWQAAEAVLRHRAAADRSARVAVAIREAERDAAPALAARATAAADDARILGALGEGGLLPPGPDVLATVEYLGEHGIPALPGWRYLAQAVDPADHAAVLAARPELVDGVVITDPDAHTRAREVLGSAALLPRSAVAVGTAAALLAPVPDPGTGSDAQHDGVFLVPPNPAMHDEHAADEERHALRSRAAARDEDIRTLAARLAGDRALAARIGSWRADCPPGMLAELAEAAATARTAAESAEAVLTEARTARAEADEVAADTARVRDERQEATQRARRVADALAGLAHRLRERARWQVRLRELVDEAAESEARAAVCLDLARSADEDRRAAQRAGDDARRTARALRAERAEIAGAPEILPEPDETKPRTALPTLREAYRAASQLYEKVGVGADLRAEQARAESDESAALAELDRLTNKVRTRAAQLLEGTDGADGPSRQAAAARAESHVQLLETRASTASEQLGRFRGEAERLAPDDERPHHTELPDELVPADAEQAQTLLRTATAELASATAALDTARAAHSELLHAHRTAEDSAGGFDETAALLRDLLRDHGTEDGTEAPDPYPGTLEEARQSATEARRSLRGCTTDLSAAESAVREASDILVRHANSTRYEQVRTPARQQIRELPASALPEHAQKWADAFAPRLRVLTDELIQLERNRDSIVDRLRGLVESALATLRSAQRLSQLPEGLGEWSGQEFVRIRFEEPDQATLTERLGEVIDEATRAALKKNSDLRRDGVSLLLRGVEAALQPKGISVEILKPDAVLRAERVPVGQMGDVFSGGQLLTAAIALYCTMAALRSNDRGRDRHRHAGTLFLDNPIGRANATYLLELQRAVSDALGVQLLYTTGLFDTTALAEFPLVIRLRNDADLRAGLKYISVEEHLRPGLPQQDPDGETVHGEITATRMFKRSTQQAAEQEPEA
ncbi:hypothetical protein SFUL_927 [Streptomyces microflavus DSM 40593]|uniref:Chromosome segregation ATPase n=1 Tax=Streptomyces microflavus DSM 40593 TaxID=1303692 RepID=N0CS74_STRMI|nr:hypothetical protein [Streptomyces microflavus]AGK75907.1 hypothetical protein SFUL_927 [Streptomyces microflavus DSM 40593]